MISDYLSALRARWRIELAIILLVMVAIAVVVLVTPKTYSAKASLLFDTSQLQPVAGASSGNDADLLGTQADVIRSNVIASAAADRAQLSSSPDLINLWRKSTRGTVDFNSWIGNRLLQSMSIEADKGSEVLTIDFDAPDAQFAATMANAFVQSYLDQRLEMQTAPAKSYAKWFEVQTQGVRKTLEEAQNKLTDFQRKTGIVDNGSFDAEAARLTSLSNQLVAAEAAEAQVDSKNTGGVDASGDVQNASGVAQLRIQIAVKSAEIQQMRTTMGPNHPAMIAAVAELQALKSKLADEEGTAATVVRVADSSATSTVAEIRSKLDAQRARMLSLAGDRGELIGLQRDVDSARSAYDAVTQRLLTMRLQSTVPGTNARLLDMATPPVFPSRPNVPLMLSLGLIFAVMAAAGLVAFLEFRRPRVRTDQGLELATGIAVLSRIEFSRLAHQPRLLGVPA